MGNVGFHDGSTLHIPDHVLTRRASGETVLLSLETEQYYSLSDVGSRVWELIEAGVALPTVIATVADEYDATLTIVTADITELVTDLAAKGLLSIDAP